MEFTSDEQKDIDEARELVRFVEDVDDILRANAEALVRRSPDVSSQGALLAGMSFAVEIASRRPDLLSILRTWTEDMLSEGAYYAFTHDVELMITMLDAWKESHP